MPATQKEAPRSAREEHGSCMTPVQTEAATSPVRSCLLWCKLVFFWIPASVSGEKEKWDSKTHQVASVGLLPSQTPAHTTQSSSGLILCRREQTTGGGGWQQPSTSSEKTTISTMLTGFPGSSLTGLVLAGNTDLQSSLTVLTSMIR